MALWRLRPREPEALTDLAKRTPLKLLSQIVIVPLKNQEHSFLNLRRAIQSQSESPKNVSMTPTERFRIQVAWADLFLFLALVAIALVVADRCDAVAQ